MTFNPGDIVRLNSGGPMMTVARYDPAEPEKKGVFGINPAQPERVFCEWFTEQEECKGRWFDTVSLKK